MVELFEAKELKPVFISAVLTRDSGRYMGYALRLYDETGGVTAAIIPEETELREDLKLPVSKLTTMKPGKAPAGDYDQFSYALSEFLRINTETDTETVKAITAAGIDQYLNDRGYMLSDILRDRPFEN